MKDSLSPNYQQLPTEAFFHLTYVMFVCSKLEFVSVLWNPFWKHLIDQHEGIRS